MNINKSYKHIILFICILSYCSLIAQNERTRLLSDTSFYTSAELIYNFRFEEAEEHITQQISTEPLEPLLARMNLLWWKGLVSGEENTSFEKLKAIADSPGKHVTDNSKSSHIHNIFQLSGGIYLIRLAAMKGNNQEAFRTFLNILPNLREVLSNPYLSEEYTLLAGVYNYAAGNFKKQNFLLRPFFVFMPSTDIEKGKELLIRCTNSDNNAIATEARYFLFKTESEITENLEAAREHLNWLIDKNPGNIIFRIEQINLYKKLGIDHKVLITQTIQLTEHSALLPLQKAYLLKNIGI